MKIEYQWLATKLQCSLSAEKEFSCHSLVEESLRICRLASAKEAKDKTLVVVKDTPFMAARLTELILPYFEKGEVLLYVPEESLRSEAIASSYENRAESIHSLFQLLYKAPKILITSPYGLMRHLPQKEELKKRILPLSVGQRIEREKLVSFLQEAGYERVSHVEKPLSYAVRGSILDVFSVNNLYPWRIEFFDDEIDSLREFTISHQESHRHLDHIVIAFAKDVYFSEKEIAYLETELHNTSGSIEMDLSYIQEGIFTPKLYVYNAYFQRQHLLDYLPSFTLLLSNAQAIKRHVKFLQEDTISYIEEASQAQEMPACFRVMADWEEIISSQQLHFIDYEDSTISQILEVDLPLLPLRTLLKMIVTQRKTPLVLGIAKKEYAEVKEALQLENISFQEGDFKEEGNIYLLQGDYPQGFSFFAEFTLYTNSELFRTHRRRSRFTTTFDQALALQSFDELKVGDYVVHDQYGIGQYMGIEQRDSQGYRQDYLKIAYAGEDVLLVPLPQFSLVRKYVSKEGITPRLHKLGSKQWQKTREKVAENVALLAKRLVESFALREQNSGFAFSKDSTLQQEFEAEFPYELTQDQQKAICEVKADMEKPQPMDRLLCGDVGFGKTEVALRAAFKAVVDKKQVAYLCPTTILSFQHFKTFAERLLNYPVNVALLNRFTSPAEQKEILRRLKSGQVDIIIGTHRLLSKDVCFQDLGLLIIDEEQRFGVEHKEKIKEYKETVDFLALSATPIPRTLQMSLIGIYGLSTLDTPPRDRYPIQTYVVVKNQGLIQEAIMRELQRGGQVFYLHNDIEKMMSLAKKLQQDIPYGKVAIAHGQMNKEEIEDVMLRFYRGEINILLCTTIIETGIDIPNANTILVENAENFGLAQLYQIKGRVGRNDRVAYAYLLIPKKKSLSEKSQKRLEAIKEFTALGSGYKIAMRDLAIRGAGDLLGDKQSGFIENVGLDLYLNMLSEAVKKEKGEAEEAQEKIVDVNLPLSGFIPQDFSYNDYDKLGIYHCLEEMNDLAQLQRYELKLKDEYGKLPKEVTTLFAKKRLAILIAKKEVESAKVQGNYFTVTLSKETSARIDGYKLFAYCNKTSKDIKIKYTKERLVLLTPNRKAELQRMIQLVDKLKELEK